MKQEPLPICVKKSTGAGATRPGTNSADSHSQICFGRFAKISFHRTLRIPEDGKAYPLPAGFGTFPIHRVEDYPDTVPQQWLMEAGFFIPLYQKEALFLEFEGLSWHPNIAKVCVGRVNAITGKQYSEELSTINQDYVVIPAQKWLDGIASNDGTVRQFVAMPLGDGYTIESQITDEEKFGGFQVVVFDAVDGRFPDRDPRLNAQFEPDSGVPVRLQLQRDIARPPLFAGPTGQHPEAVVMGIAAGGRIKQQIQKDTFGADSWDTDRRRGVTIHLVNSLGYKAITGLEPPNSPITWDAYKQQGIPWFSHYDESVAVVEPPATFKRVFGVSELQKRRGILQSEPARQIPTNIKLIRTPDTREASEQHRNRAYVDYSHENWESALREISYVIDLDADVCADDYALRSSCNYHLENYKDGEVDATLGLRKDSSSLSSLCWRAYCKMALRDLPSLQEDIDSIIQQPEAALIGLELRAEASLLSSRYDEAIADATAILTKEPGHVRADEIIKEARERIDADLKAR